MTSFQRLSIAFIVTGLLSPVSMAQERELGWLSKQYEVGNRGSETVSSGKLASGQDDPGGKSYGTFQLASKRGLEGASVKVFVETYYETDFGRFDATKGKQEWLVPGSSEFDEKWREVVMRDGDRFRNNEHEFIFDTHYKPVVEDVKKATGLDIEMRGDALKNVVWSTAVQHGSALDASKGHGHKLIQSAVKGWSRDELSVTQGKPEQKFVSDRDLIDAIYEERERRNPRDAERYKRERGDALSAQSREPPPGEAPDLNSTALGQFSRRIGIVAGPDRSPPKELFVERGQATFDFSGYETPYLTSRKPTVPGAYSGVRIGRAYDLGMVSREQAASDLKAVGLPDKQIETYSGAAGLKGEVAKKYLDKFAYGPLYSEGQKAGLKGAELSKFISERSPQAITLAQQKSLFERTYARAEDEARKTFPDFDKFPEPAKEAVADMVFDRGIDELKATRPGFLDHVAKQEWDIAAVVSKRNGAGVKRNQEIRQLLEKAAAIKSDKKP